MILGPEMHRRPEMLSGASRARDMISPLRGCGRGEGGGKGASRSGRQGATVTQGD